MIPSDGAVKLAKEWFKKEIPADLLVRFNPREIVHAHSYGGLSKFFKGLTEGVLYGTKCWDCGGPEGNIWLPPRVHCYSPCHRIHAPPATPDHCGLCGSKHHD